MKSAPWLVLGGAVAGFLGVLGLHRPAAPGALANRPAGQRQASPGAARSAGRPAPPAAGASPARSCRTGTASWPPGSAISRGRITGVSVPVLKTAEQFSQQLAAQVIPTLRNEVLAAQSARIQAVSGATYTSEAYAQSVQAALDKAHLRVSQDGLVSHAEPVMGTVVSFALYPGELPGPDLRAALQAACAVLHDADAVFSTWDPGSPLSLLRRGAPLSGGPPPVLAEVLGRLPAGPGRLRRLVRPVGHARRLRPHRAGQRLGGGPGAAHA